MSDLPNHTDVCKLCRATGYVPGGKRPENYPEEYFARFEIDQEVLLNVLGRLRSDDMYNQRAAFPSPDHRSAAFGGQASQLYVVLYFVPEILHQAHKYIYIYIHTHTHIHIHICGALLLCP